jgi:hypothetical protein
MVCSKDSENINIKMDDNALKQVPKFRYLGSIFTEGWKNKEDIIQRIKEAKVMFNNTKQLLCSNNLSLEMKKKLIKSCLEFCNKLKKLKLCLIIQSNCSVRITLVWK